MRVFINDLSSSLGATLRAQFQQGGHEVVGSVNDATALGATKRKILSHASSDTATAPVDPVVFRSNEQGMTSLLRDSDLIVYSIHDNPGDALIALRTLDSFQTAAEEEEGKHYVFVGVSTILTWTKNATPVSEDFQGFNEDDYKTRKPSRKFAEYKAVETQIIGFSRPERISTFIIASGLLYGGLSNQFEYLLKEAWTLQHEALPIPSLAVGNEGNNVLPMINIHDLARITIKLGVDAATSFEMPAKPYIIAVDNAQSTLRDVTTAVSDTLGMGKVSQMTPAEANDLLLKDPSIAGLQVNLRFNAASGLVAGLGLELKFTDGLIKNIDSVVEDYITSKDLRPIRACVLGPPCSGKSEECSRLAKDYHVPLISAKTLIQNVLDNETPIDDDILLHMTLDEYTQLRTDLGPFRDYPTTLPLALWKKLFQLKAKSSICRNHGYILDGFPDSFESAKAIFEIKNAEENEEADDEATPPPTDDADEEEVGDDEYRRRERKKRLFKVLSMTHVILLDAADDVLKERALALPEEIAKQSANTEDLFLKRLKLFRAENDPENPENLASFFEKFMKIDVLELFDHSESKRESVTQYIESGGKPFNYHPTLEEIQTMEKEQEIRIADEAAKDEEAQQELLKQELAENSVRVEKESTRLQLLQQEEAELLAARSKPLRAYLMETVVPALTEGMLEIVKMQPEDPIDFLSEFLFKKGNELENQK